MTANSTHKGETNSAELFLMNRATLHEFGESIANGTTAESVKLAQENFRRANRLLAQTQIEYGTWLLGEIDREEAREKASESTTE